MPLRPLLVLLALTGCARDFPTPPPLRAEDAGRPRQALGSVCRASEDCQSGVCADGTCCEKACASDQRCDAPHHLGECTPRQLGEACAGDEACPSGHCADGVCCESACTQLCAQCDSPVSPGVCVLVPDGEDPHRDCPGTCGACFGGSCGPALIGDNPHGACDADAGLACGAGGTCKVLPGGRCAASLDCAGGSCLNGTCLRASLEQIQLPPMSNLASSRAVDAVAANALGDLAIVFSEYREVQDSSGNLAVYEDAQLVALKLHQEAWRVYRLFQRNVSSPTARRAHAVFEGRVLEVMGVNDPRYCDNLTPETCGVFFLEFYPDGTPTTPLLLDPTSLDVYSPQLTRGDTLGLTYYEHDRLHRWTRGPGEPWAESLLTPALPDGQDWGGAWLNTGGGYALYLVGDAWPYGGEGLAVYAADGGALSERWAGDGGLPCPTSAAIRDLGISVQPDGGSAFSATCLDADRGGEASALIGAYDPQSGWSLEQPSPQGLRWAQRLASQPALVALATSGDRGSAWVGVGWQVPPAQAWPDGGTWQLEQTLQLPGGVESGRVGTALTREGLPVIAFTLVATSGTAFEVPPDLEVITYQR